MPAIWPIGFVLDLVTQIRNVVFVNVYVCMYIWVRGGKQGDQLTSNLGTRWTGS